MQAPENIEQRSWVKTYPLWPRACHRALSGLWYTRSRRGFPPNCDTSGVTIAVQGWSGAITPPIIPLGAAASVLVLNAGLDLYAHSTSPSSIYRLLGKHGNLDFVRFDDVVCLWINTGS